MNNLFRGLIAGYGAKKLGGGCLGTVVVFILIWVALGQCSCKTIDTSVDIRQQKSTTLEIALQGPYDKKTENEAAYKKNDAIIYGPVCKTREGIGNNRCNGSDRKF
jgi:hypothetical protein